MKHEPLRQGGQRHDYKILTREQTRSFTQRDSEMQKVTTILSMTSQRECSDEIVDTGSIVKRQSCRRNHHNAKESRNHHHKRSARISTTDSMAFGDESYLVIQGKSFLCGKEREQTPPSSSNEPNDVRRIIPGILDSPKKSAQDTLPVISGPSFRPWSKEKRDRKKLNSDPEERQTSKREIFNLQEILAEVEEIWQANIESHTGEEFIPLVMQCKVFDATLQGMGLPSNEGRENPYNFKESDEECESTITVNPYHNEQFLSKKSLRKRVMSYYDHGGLIEPSESIFGESFNRKRPGNKIQFMRSFSETKSAIFPYAVPHFRLPLLPSSRNELVRIAKVLTRCKLLPFQFQDMQNQSSKAKERFARKPKNREDVKGGISFSEGSCRKTELQVFIPASE